MRLYAPSHASALDLGMTVSGVRQGWQGLVDGQFRQLSARDVGGIIQVGGTFLGSGPIGGVPPGGWPVQGASQPCPTEASTVWW